MKFQIKNRWTGSVQFECELSAKIAGKSYGLQLGFAVKEAIKASADLRAADLRDADLSDANLRAADLRNANLSDADLSAAYLSAADLRAANLSDANLRAANLRAANLSNADLSDADLRYANLSAANLHAADLSAANLSAANGASWIPKIENIHQKIFDAASQPNALDMGMWHKGGVCGTTHCRAGWVIALAGDGGRVLEGCWGTPAAAAAIYMASDPKLERVPNFYCDNAEALADMKRLAESESAP